MNRIDCETRSAGEFPHVLKVRTHTFEADVGPASGSTDTAPGPHDYFDAALASCKALTAMWYAKRKNIPLERIHTTVERDDTQERQGLYKLKVTLHFEGAHLTEDHRTQLTRAIAACPIHKLMTTTEVQIDTASAEEPATPPAA